METKIAFLALFAAAFMGSTSAGVLNIPFGQFTGESTTTSTSGTCLSPDPIEQARRQQIALSLYPYEYAYALQSFNDSSPLVNADALPWKDCPVDGYGSPEACPTGESATHPETADRDSTCPFTYVTCYDPDRIPTRITVAQCRCASCLDAYTNEADPNLSCQPVYHNLKVLRRKECVNGMFRYEVIDERIPVACACMRRTVANFIL